MPGTIPKLAILGVGLIGGSFGLICRKKKLAREVWGYGRREATLRKALELGLIDRHTLDLKEAVEGADVVMLALPVEGIIRAGEEIIPHLKEKAVVTDVGSAKEKIVRRMDEVLPSGVSFVGGHPIAGTEKSGPEAAFEGLFQGRHCLLTPSGKTDAKALQQVKGLWEETGAVVSTMDPEKHDRLLAFISHLPHMAAYALVNSLARKEEEFPGLFSYTAGGFKDFSRIASSSPAMWKEICLQNGPAILRAMENFKDSLSEIGRCIEAGDEARLEQIFKNSKEIRDKL